MNPYDNIYDLLGGGGGLGYPSAQQMATQQQAHNIFGLSGQRSAGSALRREAGMQFRYPNSKPEPKLPTAMIGKVTAKPGYIVTHLHHNYCDRTVTGYVRAKVLSDYTRWERFLIWLNTPWRE